MPRKSNIQFRDKLISDYKNYVRNLAYRLVRVMGLPLAHVDEYISAGYLGLVEAAERFEPREGRQFKPYAFLRIRGAIVDCIRRSTHVSGPAYRLSRALQVAQDLREELAIARNDSSYVPKVTEKYLSKSARVAQILDYAAQGVLVHKLSIHEAESDVDNICDEAESAEAQIENFQDKRILRKLLATLPIKERTILQEHYFKGKTFMEIADEHEGMSKSWVSRLHIRAINMLKERYISVMQNQSTLADYRDNDTNSSCELQGEHFAQSV